VKERGKRNLTRGKGRRVSDVDLMHEGQKGDVKVHTEAEGERQHWEGDYRTLEKPSG